MNRIIYIAQFKRDSARILYRKFCLSDGINSVYTIIGNTRGSFYGTMEHYGFAARLTFIYE